MITIIVARARNGAIGRNGTIPWHIPADLKFFQRETVGGALVMGRRTWESLPVKPLPRRHNIVVSSTLDAGAAVAPTWTEALALAAGHARVYAIGGARIYADALPVADRLLISDVDTDVPDADTFFPTVELDGWDLSSAMPLHSDGPACTVYEYLRRR